MADLFENYSAGLTSPLSRSEVADVSAEDHTFTNVTRAVLLSEGVVVMRLVGDEADLTLTVTGGAFLPLRVAVVRNTGTTATSVVGLW